MKTKASYFNGTRSRTARRLETLQKTNRMAHSPKPPRRRRYARPNLVEEVPVKAIFLALFLLSAGVIFLCAALGIASLERQAQISLNRLFGFRYFIGTR